ncbi:MAG TPA: hypothetical protein VGM41_06635 [Chitinophagaceae bacterium]
MPKAAFSSKRHFAGSGPVDRPEMTSHFVSRVKARCCSAYLIIIIATNAVA